MDPQKIDDIISTLARESGWSSNDKYPLYHYQGFWYGGFFLRGAIAAKTRALPGFDPSPSDIVLASNPKSGTTWLKALSFAIATRASGLDQDKSPLRSKNPHDLMLRLEGGDLTTRDPNLPLISTHLPYTGLPDSVSASGCKIVYIWRDPKDAFVSLWHFFRKIVRSNREIVTKPIPLEEAFDHFCRGISAFGPYWDHVLGYWNASLEHPHKILVLKYEDMLDDVEVHVKRLAEFMGFPFSVEEENEGVLGKIVEMCSFESLSNLEVNKGGQLGLKGSLVYPRDAFFRKGKVGDWKNYLTEEMAKKIDQITIDKLGASGLKL